MVFILFFMKMNTVLEALNGCSYVFYLFHRKVGNRFGTCGSGEGGLSVCKPNYAYFLKFSFGLSSKE